MSRAPPIADLRRAWAAALGALDPRAMVAAALAPTPPTAGRVRLLAVGKGAPLMAAGALDRWGARIDRALVVTSRGTSTGAVDGRAEVVFAGHPLPDASSAEAAERALSLAAGAAPGDLLLALISGGTSALLEAPPFGLGDAHLDGVPIDDDLGAAAWIARRLVDSGATIQRINLVRRHLSRVKGGRLAIAALPGDVFTLYARDVPAGRAHDVGSGPTVPSPGSIAEARDVLDEVLGGAVAERIAPFLSDGLRPESPHAGRAFARPVATPATLGTSVARELRQAGFAVTVAPERTLPASELVDEIARRAVGLAPGEAWVAPTEPTLRVTAGGRGGRAGWTALACLGRLPPDVALLAGASDGVDGASGAAGACVSGSLAFDRGEAARALARFDDAGVHAALGTHLAGGPTGLNLTDVFVLARARA